MKFPDSPDQEHLKPDIVLLDGISHQFQPLLLLEDAQSLLGTKGELVLVVRQDKGDAPPRMVQWLEYVDAIAARLGMHRDAGAEQAWSALLRESVRSYRKNSNPVRWRISFADRKDYQAVAHLFELVFGHPLSRTLWEWKYGQGRGNAVIASREAGLVAHYGGMYRDVRMFGSPEWVLQIGDVMVHPKERGVMTRQGPFLLTAATSAEINGPYGFGFPTTRAMQVAEKMGLYSEVDQLVEMHWSPLPRKLVIQSQLQVLDLQDPSTKSVVNQLWERLAADLAGSVIGVRDWSYLSHRYGVHPHNQYEVLLVRARLTRQPLGIIVVRIADNSCELLDVIGPLQNLCHLLIQARRACWLRNAGRLYCWITKSHMRYFSDCGGKDRDINISIPASTWTNDDRAMAMKGKWWLMGGDTDFR